MCVCMCVCVCACVYYMYRNDALRIFGKVPVCDFGPPEELHTHTHTHTHIHTHNIIYDFCQAQSCDYDPPEEIPEKHLRRHFFRCYPLP